MVQVEERKGLLMSNEMFFRKSKEDMPVVAICYDFDKTLSPDDMQAQGYIQSIGYDIKDFWNESNKLASDNDMDQNLAYMYKMMEEARGRMVFNKKTLMDYGARVQLFDGVESWFERIREYGKHKNVIVEHYIISSGLKEMIEGTKVANAFERIYASSFYYNERGEAKWPAQVVNYTNKTQFLFRIEKGVLDVNDSGVNDYFSKQEIRVPFRNIIYIGDSDTDIPCMKLVNSYGGHSIGVYNAITKDKSKVYKMMYENRIKYFAPADYSEGSVLDSLVKAIIDRTETNEKLEEFHYENVSECERKSNNKSELERKKYAKIIALEESQSYAATHTIINDLDSFSTFNDQEANHLCSVAIKNSQVRAIIEDADVKAFYMRVISEMKKHTNQSRELAELLDLDMKTYQKTKGKSR